tara:strand:- start:6023 stop:7123 length:1101 start_codon:yes stop_codon:yes gene_type:complete
LNYKETIYFISKSLTISLDENNRQEIQKQLQSKTIDWKNVVEVSTSHYVFPAMYCNLKRVGFLSLLPKDLVNYMEYITNLNRERNQQIITQAKGLNTLLLKNNITPIFLKGTANLLAGIYDDIAERMVGDIDFLFSKEDYPNAITVLRENGYYEVNKSTYYFPYEKHYRRLQKDNNIAAIEIHRELLDVKKYIKEFNYDIVKKDCQVIDEICVLSYANKLNLTILSKQINDSGFYFKTIPLRSAYDVFLFSKKTSVKDAVNSLCSLKYHLNCFLASCYEVFNSIESLNYNNTKKIAAYLTDFNSQLANPKATHRKHKRIQMYLFLKHRLNIIYKSILYKDYRVWLFKRLTDKNWYKQKLIQLGIKQ